MTNDTTTPAADAGRLDQPVGRPVPERANAPQAKCPNPPTGHKCKLCGGEMYCMEPWRAKA